MHSHYALWRWVVVASEDTDAVQTIRTATARARAARRLRHYSRLAMTATAAGCLAGEGGGAMLAQGRVVTLGPSSVVPAKAGTHTPCRRFVARPASNFEETEYGSPLSRGRPGERPSVGVGNLARAGR